MKDIRNVLLIFCFFSFLTNLKSTAQESNCENLGFELGNFTNWVGHTWIYSTEVTSINTSKVEGIVNRRQTIVSDTTAYDANTGYALRKVPKGYLYSARLGDEIVSTDGNPRAWQQSLRYTMTIDSSNALLVFKFACVLQYGSDHTEKVEPRFRLSLYDSKGNEISDCSNYDVYSSASYVEGFRTYTLSGSNSDHSVVNWRDWTTVGANLLKYYGQEITIEFLATDCTGRYHFGYAYFVAACHPLNITVDYCYGDSIAVLNAPEGFESYSWQDNSGQLVDTVQMLEVANPIEGDVYSCVMESETGCTVSLQSTIAKYLPNADFNSYMLDCNSNTVQFANLSTVTNGKMQYIWDFGDGTTSTSRNPYHTFITSGMHPMKLILLNPPSTCTDTISKEVESFSPPLVGIAGDSTYCPNESVFLIAYGAYDYTWSTGSKADSIEVSAPGGNFWLLGRSSTGCVSDTIRKSISGQPEWEFLSDCDSDFCYGDSLLLIVSGAAAYLWNTGDTINSITVDTSGTYYVTGVDERGCDKELSFDVIEYPLPDVDFTVSTTELNNKYNLLSGSITPENNVDYYWDLGDGSSEYLSEFEHYYNVSEEISMYILTLTATSEHNCVDSASKIIDVVPFVPNVFTPNSDGVNELFMNGYDIEIFDRNGILIYEGDTGWNGRYKGKNVDPDTYFYLIQYKNREQKTVLKKGYVTLVS